MSAHGEQSRPRARRLRLFATCAPGLGRMLRRQLDSVHGIDVTGTGFDGRADVVFFEADRVGRAEALRSRLAADIVAEIGRANRAGGAGAAAVARMAWQPDAVQRALSVWASEIRPLAGSMTFRVSARVLSEARFPRTDLRRALADLIARDKPRWRLADDAQLEIWISEFHDGQYVTGLRLGGAATPQRPGREPDRQSALRTTVAAAMVDLAGSPGPAGQAAGTLLDPCCGAGAILAEALAAGWAAEGTDISAAEIEAAARTAPGAHVQLGDARELLLPDGGARRAEPRDAQRRVRGPAGAGAAAARSPERIAAAQAGAGPASGHGSLYLGAAPGLTCAPARGWASRACARQRNTTPGRAG